jgi:hypothetical protein
LDDDKQHRFLAVGHGAVRQSGGHSHLSRQKQLRERPTLGDRRLLFRMAGIGNLNGQMISLTSIKGKCVAIRTGSLKKTFSI